MDTNNDKFKTPTSASKIDTNNEIYGFINRLTIVNEYIAGELNILNANIQIIFENIEKMVSNK